MSGFQSLSHPDASPETVPCIYCGQPTPMLATRLCNNCWELDRRMRADPALARKILDAVERSRS